MVTGAVISDTVTVPATVSDALPMVTGAVI